MKLSRPAGAALAFAVLVAAVAALGISRPGWLPTSWFNEDSAAWWTFLVALLTLLVTALIPVALYFFTRAGQQESQRVWSELHLLAQSQRMDQLTEQAMSLTDPEDLRIVKKEADRLDELAVRRVAKAYWMNPGVPLSGHKGLWPLDAGSAKTAASHLSEKLAGEPTWIAVAQLERFLDQAVAAQSPSLAREISKWVLESHQGGRSPVVEIHVRGLIKHAQDDQLFATLLAPLDQLSLRLPGSYQIEVVGGVAGAYLDRVPNRPVATRDLPEGDRALAADVLAQFTSLLHRYRLHDLANVPATGLSIDPPYVAALTAATVGMASFADSHGAWRCLSNVPGLYGSGNVPQRGIDRYLDLARDAFAFYQPALWSQAPF